MEFLKSLFGKQVDLTEDISNGALVVDVRSTAEFQGGHVKGSINIPLNEISANENKLKNYNKKVIFCCASGNRSGRATSIMQQKGLDCINGGSWLTVNSYT
jgi:rhodanese-related sulfurtransferase